MILKDIYQSLPFEVVKVLCSLPLAIVGLITALVIRMLVMFILLVLAVSRRAHVFFA